MIEVICNCNNKMEYNKWTKYYFCDICGFYITVKNTDISEFHRDMVEVKYQMDMGNPIKANKLLDIKLEKWEQRLDS